VSAGRRRAVPARTRYTPTLRTVRADLASGEGFARLPRQVEAIVFCAAPDERDEAAYRRLFLDGLRRLLDAVDAPRLLFVSSTAVYAEDAGEWIDEATPAHPVAFNGRGLPEAEHVLAPVAGASVLRLSGLYGPGRDALLRRARGDDPPPARWSNRIHVDDAAHALSHLLDHAVLAPTYLGNDDRPVLEAEVVAWMRAQEGLPPLAPAPGPARGRRVSNARLRASGWAPRHPDFTSGYASMLTRPGP